MLLVLLRSTLTAEGIESAWLHLRAWSSEWVERALIDTVLLLFVSIGLGAGSYLEEIREHVVLWIVLLLLLLEKLLLLLLLVDLALLIGNSS